MICHLYVCICFTEYSQAFMFLVNVSFNFTSVYSNCKFLCEVASLLQEFSWSFKKIHSTLNFSTFILKLIEVFVLNKSKTKQTNKI